MAAIGPPATSGDVRYCAAIGGQADTRRPDLSTTHGRSGSHRYTVEGRILTPKQTGPSPQDPRRRLIAISNKPRRSLFFLAREGNEA
jgi:hypothetical protein